MTAAYGCCGQALTRFTGHPCTGPGRLRGRRCLMVCGDRGLGRMVA